MGNRGGSFSEEFVIRLSENPPIYIWPANDISIIDRINNLLTLGFRRIAFYCRMRLAKNTVLMTKMIPNGCDMWMTSLSEDTAC